MVLVEEYSHCSTVTQHSGIWGNKYHNLAFLLLQSPVDAFRWPTPTGSQRSIVVSFPEHRGRWRRETNGSGEAKGDWPAPSCSSSPSFYGSNSIFNGKNQLWGTDDFCVLTRSGLDQKRVFCKKVSQYLLLNWIRESRIWSKIKSCGEQTWGTTICLVSVAVYSEQQSPSFWNLILLHTNVPR